MRKLLCGVMAVVVTVCMSITAMAASSSVSVKNNVTGSEPVSYTYDSDKSAEIVQSIKPLMTKLSDLSKSDSVVQTLTLSSESSVPVLFKLRLSIPDKTDLTVKPEVVQTPSPDEYSALEYYNIQITDSQGNEIYSYENENNEKNEQQNTYKDISLGVLNTTDSSENKIYNITLSVNKKMNKSSIAEKAENIDWSIVSDTSEDMVNQAASSAASPTADIDENKEDKPNDDKNGVVTLSKGEYICGKDIAAGRYTITGKGKVHVYTTEDVLKTTIALKDKNDSSSNGVDEYVINILDGEKIEVDADIKFTPYTASTATAKPSATNSPKPSASSSKSTDEPKNASNKKDNPKTGDDTQIAGMSILGVVALGAFAFVTIKKRKEN